MAAAIHYGPGGALVDACATMMSSMGEGFRAFSDAFNAGQGFGWHQRTADHWHGTDAFTRVALPVELIAAAIGDIPDVAAALSAGGTAVDVGCGYGAPTIAIAGLYPAAQILGIDYHDASIAHCRAEAAAGGVGNVRFEVAAATELPGQDYDLIAFFDSLHDIGDARGALARARAAVAATGAVLLFEPLGADDVQDNLTSRLSLVALGVREPASGMDTADPLWPMLPMLTAWPLAVRGELDAASAALGDFSVLDISVWTGLEGLAAAAVVFAAVGSDGQRSWAYDQLRPYAGTHVVVGGCASYHAAADHHLGALAASLGDIAGAERHFRAALEMHERLGAAGWARLSEQALAELTASQATRTSNEFCKVDGFWLLSYQGKQAQLPDSKGLRDLAVLIASQGADVHVLTLIGDDVARTGSDDRAKRNSGRGSMPSPARSSTPRSPLTLGWHTSSRPSARQLSTSLPPPPGWADAPGGSATRPSEPGRPSAPG